MKNWSSLLSYLETIHLEVTAVARPAAQLVDIWPLAARLEISSVQTRLFTELLETADEQYVVTNQEQVQYLSDRTQEGSQLRRMFVKEVLRECMPAHSHCRIKVYEDTPGYSLRWVQSTWT